MCIRDRYLTDNKSRITREIHAAKKTREFHDNESENIRVESELLCRCGTILQRSVGFIVLFPVIRNSSNKHRIGGAALIRRRRLLICLSRKPRLFEGGGYSSKYGTFRYQCSRLKVWSCKCFDLTIDPNWVQPVCRTGFIARSSLLRHASKMQLSSKLHLLAFCRV